MNISNRCRKQKSSIILILVGPKQQNFSNGPASVGVYSVETVVCITYQSFSSKIDLKFNNSDDIFILFASLGTEFKVQFVVSICCYSRHRRQWVPYLRNLVLCCVNGLNVSAFLSGS